ncbi:MAG: carboxyl transferase domain-containing protein, partial [Candidatus Dormibacteria bacterium]
MSAAADRSPAQGGGQPTRRRELTQRQEAARRGGPERYRSRLKEQRKLEVRQRLRLLFDAQSPFVEDGLLANSATEEMGADGVVTGVGMVAGRRVCVMANDPTVKAGSWGP